MRIAAAPIALSLTAWARDRIARLQATDGFRRAAGAFPLTRPVARRQGRALFDLCAGFVYSQVLLAVVRLRLPERGPGTRTGDDGLGSLGAALIDNPGVTAMIEHHGLLYDDLRDPVALLRGESTQTALADFWPYARRANGGEGAATPEGYSALMAVSQRFVAAEVLGAYPLRRHRHLLDVGGGSGAFLMAAGAHAPNLRLTLFDLPAVADIARTSPVAARCAVVGGDFTIDALPAGADVVSLVRVLHDHDDHVAAQLLRAIRQALPPGGTLLIAEPMAGTRGCEPVGDAYFGFYFLAMGGGRARTPYKIKQMLSDAGFARSRLLRGRMPMVARVMVAQ
jgi:demethylspheroidene O-methyltransferase